MVHKHTWIPMGEKYDRDLEVCLGCGASRDWDAELMKKEGE